MKRHVWIGGVAALALVCGVGLSAQSSSSQTSTANTTTVTGCLKPADQVGGTVGTTGTAPSTSSSSTSANRMENFVLTTKRNATSTGSSSSSVGTSGSMSNERTYILDGDSTELKAHTNQEVEITGRIESWNNSSSSSTSSSSTSTTSSTSSTPSSSSTAERIRVQSVRMIAESCSSK